MWCFLVKCYINLCAICIYTYGTIRYDNFKMLPRGSKYLQNSNGLSTDPWGTPQVVFFKVQI